MRSNKDNREEDMGVPHIAGQLNNDLYAIPVKRRSPKNTDEIDSISPDKERYDYNDLPPGWEKHEGKDSFYEKISKHFLYIFKGEIYFISEIDRFILF